ncbi:MULTISPECIES: hypothetical protein [unclassified Microbacterium]|uniref:hypothetical protein n=1 Tax=unclassified Microbacterium TaxID=2609290 RepID=UPI0038666485
MAFPIVLSEAPAGVQITATLLSRYPAPVQVVLTNMPVGAEYVVEGTAGGFVWPVNAGTGVSTGEQVVLIDLVPPINTEVIYTLTVAGETYQSNPVIVEVLGDFILQTLDADLTVVPLTVADGGFERDYGIRQATFSIPGRARPVVRYDSLTDGTGSLSLTTDAAQSEALIDVLESGAPVVYRQNGIRDLPLVEVVLFSSIKSTSLIDDLRSWDLAYILTDNPEPGVAAVVYTWDDFDAVHEDETWAVFDSEWAGRTWDEFDRHEWTDE